MADLITLVTKPGGYMESQSGLQRSNPTIYGRLEGDANRDLAFLVFHPTSNFHGHYLLKPIGKRGASILALNTRYIGNDSMLIMERAIQDVGAGVRFLRDQRFRRVVLIGNSGGGSLASLYQQQATTLSITTTPDGRPFELAAADVPLADGVALLAAHPGRAEQLLAKIDPAVLDENDSAAIDSKLDMFDEEHGPPYDIQWLDHYRGEQAKRLRRIVRTVEHKLQELERDQPPETADDAFIIRRTQADPRNLDLTLDANERRQGTLGGEARSYNMAANGLARFCTLRSFLSQWSPWHTRANGPRCLADVKTPKLIIEYTADQTVFPSQISAWREAAGPEGSFLAISPGTHYLNGQPELVNKVADALVSWGKSLPRV
jgi:pimeloyl-ACP methyl ester carboxylesterase